MEFILIIAVIFFAVNWFKTTKKLDAQIEENEKKEDLLNRYRQQNVALQTELRRVRQKSETEQSEHTESSVQADIATTESSVQADIATTEKSVVAAEKNDKEKNLEQKPAKVKKPRRQLSSGMILFAVGIVLILTAGTIFATTTWQLLPAIGKIAVLLAAVFVFMGSAFIAQKKFELRETSITFYILGSCFLSVINLAIGYFEWFGDFYATRGEGAELVWGISAIIVAVCFFIGRVIYNARVMEMLGYYSLLIGVMVVTAFFTDELSVFAIPIGLYLLVTFAYVYFIEIKTEDILIGKSCGWLTYIYIIFVLLTEMFDTSRDIPSFYIAAVLSIVIAILWSININKSERKWQKRVSAGISICAISSLGLAFHGFSDSEDRFMLTTGIFAISYLVWSVLKLKFEENRYVDKIVYFGAHFWIALGSIITIFACSSSDVEIKMGVMTALAAVICVCSHFEKSNNAAVAGYLSLYFDICFWLSELCDTRYSIVGYLITLAVFVVAQVIGRLLYKKLSVAVENAKYIIRKTDWISICSVILIIGMFDFAESADKNWMWFLAELLLMGYFANAWGRVSDLAGRICLSVSTIIGVFVWGNQPFWDVPRHFNSEWWIIGTMLGTVAGSFIWKNARRWYNYVWAVIIAGCFWAQMDSIYWVNDGVYRELASFKLFIYLIGVIGLFIAAYVFKTKVFLVETGAVLVMFSFIEDSIDANGIFILAAVIGLAYMVYMYSQKYFAWIFLPILQIDILLINWDLPEYVWILRYVIGVVGGLMVGQYIKAVKETEKYVPNWLAISALLPVLYVFSEFSSKWEFSAYMMLALYVFSYYKQIKEDGSHRLNRIILTLTSVIVGFALLNNSLIEVPHLVHTEYCVAVILVIAWINMLFVYKSKTDDVAGWIVFAVTVFCILWQASDALRDENIFDVLILGIAMILSIIVSYIFRKKQWFIMSAIVLVGLTIYASRAFWLSVAWWVYLLVAGAVLIFIAAGSEYRKHKDVEKERRQWFENWTL